MPLASPTPSENRPRVRRKVLRALLVIAALGIFIGVPAYLSAQPGFFERYPGLAEQYVPWSASTHVDVTCEACHVPPRTLDRGAYRARMVGELYLSLVSRARAPQVFATPTNDACLRCHADLRTVSPRGDLQIPHRAHVQILKMECVTCHEYLVHELSPEGSHNPRMVACLQCHDGDRAQDACTACHTQKAAPDNHASAQWLVTHADHAADPACAQCHEWTEDWCVDCHRDRPRSHAADWRQTHGEAVATHRSCEACHEPAFCVRCHGDVPQLDFDPTLALVE